MRTLGSIADRIVPPLLMAAGVTLVGAGLLSYGGGTAASQIPGDDPSSIGPPITSGPTLRPSPTVGPTVVVPSSPPSTEPSGTPDASLSPGPETPTPTPQSTVVPAAMATRIVVPSQGIDLAIMSRLQRVPGQGPDRYPPCDVALVHDAFGQPAEEGTTYLYAHAQAGMFLPLLEASRRRNGEELIGALVEVYTDDSRLFVYSIDQVKRHALDFSIAETEPGQYRLVMQTSEGPAGTHPKLQVAATLLSEVDAEPAAAHPRPRPRPCYGG